MQTVIRTNTTTRSGYSVDLLGLRKMLTGHIRLATTQEGLFCAASRPSVNLKQDTLSRSAGFPCLRETACLYKIL